MLGVSPEPYIRRLPLSSNRPIGTFDESIYISLFLARGTPTTISSDGPIITRFGQLITSFFSFFSQSLQHLCLSHGGVSHEEGDQSLPSTADHGVKLVVYLSPDNSRCHPVMETPESCLSYLQSGGDDGRGTFIRNFPQTLFLRSWSLHWSSQCRPSIHPLFFPI